MKGWTMAEGECEKERDILKFWIMDPTA